MQHAAIPTTGDPRAVIIPALPSLSGWMAAHTLSAGELCTDSLCRQGLRIDVLEDPLSGDQGVGGGVPDHTDASGTSPPARRRVTQRRAAFLSAAFAVFGAIASVAQLVSSTWQTLLVTLLIVLAVGLVAFGVWWTTSCGRQIASLSFRLLAALIVGALLLGAGGTAGVR